jgi:PAS domain S-box-containing protein
MLLARILEHQNHLDTMHTTDDHNSTSSGQNFYQHEFEASSAWEFFQDFSRQLSDAYCVTTEAGIIVSTNNIFAQLLGYEKEALVSSNFIQLLPENIRPYAQMLHKEYVQGKSDENAGEWKYLKQDGQKILLRSTTSRIKTDKLTYKFEIFTPVSQPDLSPSEQMKQAEGQVRKVYHQVKNTLHEISSLLQLQSMSHQGETRLSLMSAQKRVSVIAKAYEQLYQNSRQKEIELGMYLEEVLKINQVVDEQFDHQEVYFAIESAYALGIILTEYLQLYREKLVGLKISGFLDGSTYNLSLKAENGQNLSRPQGFSERLIAALLGQIKAELKPVRQEDEVLLIAIQL